MCTVAKSKRILAEIESIRLQSERSNPDSASAKFEQSYRHAVKYALDRLELVGVRASSASRRYRLSVAYVTLSIRQTHTSNDDPEEKQRIQVSIEESLRRVRRLFVRGLPGSGKTTLLQWVAVRSALQDYIEPLTVLNETIPFFIRLRDCTNTGLPKPEDFPKFVASAVSGMMPDAWVHDKLESGQAIVLVDGVDEVPALGRAEIREWLGQLTNAYGEARFIVTARTHIEEGWLRREGFKDAEILDMHWDDISNFIDHWHNAVSEELEDSDEKSDLRPLAEHLKEVIQFNRPVRSLATNPLLCAMLCALHRDGKRQMPSDRVELYRECIEVLLDRREKQRQISLADYPSLSYRQKIVLLQDLAYYLIINGWSVIPFERAEERIASKMTTLRNLSDDTTASHILTLLVERSGVIREPVKGRVDFIHRTFQEYLAAQAALDGKDIGLLVNNAHKGDWRETVVLSAGLATKVVREELITLLMKRGDGYKGRKYRKELY